MVTLPKAGSPGLLPLTSKTRRRLAFVLVFAGLAGWGGRLVASAPAEKLAITTIAGVSPGSANGTGSAARFWRPGAMTVDVNGDLFVADTNNATIRRITPAGVVTTFVGRVGAPEWVDGPAATARVGAVASMTCDAAGNLYVCDWNAIRRIAPDGTVGALPGLTHAFHSTDGVARDRSGNLYVCDGQDGTIWKVSATGAAKRIAGVSGSFGYVDGAADGSKFFLAGGLTVDSAGNVYVADTNNYVIRKITLKGVVSTLAGEGGQQGDKDGKGSTARFWLPTDIAIDAHDVLYVVDAGLNCVRRIAADGTVTTLAGGAASGNLDGVGAAARFSGPEAVAVAPDGMVYVADSGNNTVRRIAAGGVVTTLAGKASVGATNGTGKSARFHLPTGLARDAAGNLYVADQLNNQIRRITPAGVVSTVAGIADGGIGRIDGPAQQARFYGPTNVAVDAAGALYVADTMNNLIRRITTSGQVETFAGVWVDPDTSGGVGSQTPGGSDDGPAAQARFFGPRGLAFDAAGNLYVADQQNNTIRRITPDGTVGTLAGLAGEHGSQDGTGSAARFNWPTGLTIDAAGNLYVSELNNTIRKVTKTGKVTTLAGQAGDYTQEGVPSIGEGSVDGKGALARFRVPVGLAADASGNVYVADRGNNTLRVVTPSGVVTTLAGYAGLNGYGAGESGSAGYGDGRGGSARLNAPTGLVLDPAGNVYFTDAGSNTVRRGAPIPRNTPPTIQAPATLGVAVDGSGSLTVTVSDLDSPAADLTVLAASGNTTVLPAAGIRVTGDGAKRTVTLKPAAGKAGTAKLTLTVSDGAMKTATTTMVTVEKPPHIGPQFPRSMAEDATLTVSVAMSDPDTPVDQLVLTARGSDATLFPASGLVVSGKGGLRTLKIHPGNDRTGSGTITLSANDGFLTTKLSFKVTVTPVNDAPTISAIAAQKTTKNTATKVATFTIGDVDTPVAKLVLTKASSNPTLVPTANIKLGGSGANRTVTIKPAANQTGSAKITLTVSDGQASASRTFTVTVNAG